MKKALLFIVLILSMLCLASCKGKDGILGTNSSNILLEIEDENITPDDLFNNLDKYSTGEKYQGVEAYDGVPVFYAKYAKTVFKAAQNYNQKVRCIRCNFKVESQEEIDALNKYVEKLNQSTEKFDIEFWQFKTLNDDNKIIVYAFFPRNE